MNEVCQGAEASFGVAVRLQWGTHYPPTINHKIGFDQVKFIAEQVLPNGFEECTPAMTAEDFSFFLRERPGAFFFLDAVLTVMKFMVIINQHSKSMKEKNITYQFWLLNKNILFPFMCTYNSLSKALELLMAPLSDDTTNKITNESLTQQEIEIPFEKYINTQSQISTCKQDDDDIKVASKSLSNSAPIGNGFFGNILME
ncbi:amidohydrolase family protein [Reticulomyxa filosa]|uniref:Amidohydrolase family protein n=1 Tax=Reticulomyxa filosa TaxID=46433 RepID=X6MBJ7_RETFI|nr:amidohydrolase family protein [Reticulomyxa filosa]|eukprot:ETO11046.1 amidohydrolase family protein [Reticulomyxa filosa]